MKKVLVIDTSIYCVWLNVPGFSTCGRDSDRWDYERINQKIVEEVENKSTLVLPLATIIETGNHISQAKGDVYPVATKFCSQLLKSIDNENPWAAFSEQSSLWADDNLRKIAGNWSDLAVRGVSLGDATIKDVAEYYATIGYQVEIFTGDQGLKAYEPIIKERPIPRRRQ